MTQRRGDFLFNLGPDALYAAGEGVKVLQELGVFFQGGTPALGRRAKAVLDNRLYLLPQSPGTLSLRENVRYLDGGWQTLVDGLRQAAEKAGVEIVGGARVTTPICCYGANVVKL